MNISFQQLNELELRRIAEDVWQSLHGGRFEDVAQRFGYALAYGRDTASAIEADLDTYLSTDHESDAARSKPDLSTKVTFLRKNASNLVATIESFHSLPNGKVVHVALVVTEGNGALHLSLEHVYRVV